MKGFKVTDAKRSRICGVACHSLKQLIEKGSQKLRLNSKLVVVQLQDGTYVDSEDYFTTLPAQTLLLLVMPDQDVSTGYELLYNMLSAVHKNYINIGKMASDFLSQDMKTKILEISTILDRQSSSEHVKHSSREEDPLWFEELETNSNTKEEFMFKRSQERVRGYLYKSQDDVKKSHLYKTDTRARAKLDSTFSLFKAWLKRVQYFGCYFHRDFSTNLKPLKSFCDERGQFDCQGRWKHEKCHYFDTYTSPSKARHSINPYESKEARIVFSTWNLDHRIERTRQICPALIEAARISVKLTENINAKYFFSLLFTPSNLKLVHIVCHDKGEHHGAICKKEKFTTFKMPSIDDFSLKESVKCIL